MKPGPIAVFSHTPPSVTRGGAEISAYALYLGLRQLGLDAVFVSACPVADLGKVLPGSADEHVIPYESGDYDTFYHLAAPELVNAVERLVTRLGCRTLVFHHFLFLGTNTIRRMVELGHEVVLTLHEFLSLCHHHGQMVTRPGFRLCRESHPALCVQCFPGLQPDQFAARKVSILGNLDGVTAFVSPSHFLAERCRGWGFPGDRLHVIENGLIGEAHDAGRSPADPAASMRFAVEEGARHHGGGPARIGEEPFPPHRVARGADDALVIGFFGQLNPFKGLDVILDAAARLAADAEPQRCRFRVHGHVVGLNEALRTRFDEAVASGVLDYRGPYDNADVLELMRACDFILMASRWWENSPLVIQEAFLARRPLIVPGIGGMAEKVRDRVSGLHFRPSDGADLARACRLAATLGHDAFSFPVPSSSEEMARRYLAAIGAGAEVAADA